MNVASYVLDRWPALYHDQASIFFNWKENNIWALLACFKKKLMNWIIDPIGSNKMLRFNYMMKENDNKWTKFKKKRWLCWLVKRKKKLWSSIPRQLNVKWWNWRKIAKKNVYNQAELSWQTHESQLRLWGRANIIENK